MSDDFTINVFRARDGAGSRASVRGPGGYHLLPLTYGTPHEAAAAACNHAASQGDAVPARVSLRARWTTVGCLAARGDFARARELVRQVSGARV